jgi:hypothetical protein
LSGSVDRALTQSSPRGRMWTMKRRCSAA